MKKIMVIFLFIVVAFLPLACNKSANQTTTSTAAGDDARITSAVKDKISADPVLSQEKIDVDTDNAIVSLKGEVKNHSEEEQAIRLAQDVSGVRTVHSFLKANEETGAGAGSTGTENQNTTENLKDAAKDATITTKVKFDLAKAKNVSAADIHVDTVNGVVTLSGDVKDQAEIDRAIEIARSVDGVNDVNSNLAVKQEEGSSSGGSAFTGNTTEKVTDAAKDTTITAKVKFELAKAKDVSATDIHVDTVNGVVTLSGDVGSKTEIERAITITRSVDGVKHVRSDLIVKGNS